MDASPGRRIEIALRLQIRAQLFRIHGVGLRVDVDKIRLRAGLGNRFGGRDERVRHGHDDVAGRTPAAVNANRSASVPLFTPTQYFASQNSANSRSNPSTAGPPMNPAVCKSRLENLHQFRLESPDGASPNRQREFFRSRVISLPLGMTLRIERNIFAGLPATITFGGTSRVTTLPAPTMAFSPIVTLRKNRGAGTDRSAALHQRLFRRCQSFSVCSPPSAVVAPRIRIVDERHAMADENVVFDGHAFADESVAGNLAAPARHWRSSGFRRTRRSSFRRRSRSRTG